MLQLTQRDDSDIKLMYVKVVSLCSVSLVLSLLMNLIVFFHKKRQLQNLKEQESVEENEQEAVRKNTRLHVTEFDLDNLPYWEREAHVWINDQILSITNENYQE